MTYPITNNTLYNVVLPEAPSAWLGHVPFALWLVESVRPRTFVELGTHHGHSYFTFCQAVAINELDTRCYGVDTWQGDEHAGAYGATVYAAVDQRNDAYFSGFSRLLRMTFDEALGYFSDGSIDLLHIDGLHTYEAVRHDFESWQPKLSESAVVLFHDINVREREFGVWRLWEGLRAHYPSVEFAHSHGLGVLFVGPRQPAAVTALLSQWAQETARVTITALYATLGRAVEVESRARVEAARAQDLAVRLAAADASIARLDAAAEAAAQERSRQLADAQSVANRSLAEAQERLRLLADAQAATNRSLVEAQERLAAVQARLAAAEFDHRALQASTSRRLTRPYRWAGHQLRRLQALRVLVPGAIRLSGGLPQLLRKAVQVARIEGLPGVRMRLRYLASRGGALQGGPAAGSVRHVKRRLRSPEVAPHTESVDIIVCVHNALDDVRTCLQSAISKTRPPYRLIVVDDGSDVATADFLEDFMAGQPGVLIRHESAKGYTLAANAGMRQSAADFVVLLNSDTIVTPLWLDRMVECAKSARSIGLVGPLSNTASWQSVPRLFNGNGDWAENLLAEGQSVDDFADLVALSSLRVYPRVGFLNGFCLLIRRELIQAIGIFDEERFGRGFGEENDYCLRAAEAGWELAIAEDSYVFHAQSKSYSNERRLALSRSADVALRESHSDELITRSLEVTKESRILAAMRARVAASSQRAAICSRIQENYEGRRVLFVLPACDAGGGANVVVEESRALVECGVIVGIANLAQFRQAFEASYPDLDLPMIYLDAPADLAVHAASFDAVVATLFLSVGWVMKALDKVPHPPVAGYYAQDFEPYFFDPSDVNHALAKASYTAFPMRLFTKTSWNALEIEAQTGAKAAVVGPSLAWKRFVPADRPRNAVPVEIAAMVRPSTPRRSPELTVRVLERLANYFGDRVRLHVFGVSASAGLLESLGRSGRSVLHGEVTADRVAEILRTSDIFLDFSTYQAMGLTALEAMASGVAVVGPRSGGLKETLEHEVNGLLVDTANEGECFDAARRLVDDWDLRDRLIRNAMETVSDLFPERAAMAIMDVLFKDEEDAHDRS